jgi:hypothetical protein
MSLSFPVAGIPRPDGSLAFSIQVKSHGGQGADGEGDGMARQVLQGGRDNHLDSSRD